MYVHIICMVHIVKQLISPATILANIHLIIVSRHIKVTIYPANHFNYFRRRKSKTVFYSSKCCATSITW